MIYVFLLRSALPGLGTVTGAVIGGYEVGKASQFVLNALIGDDNIEMMGILKRIFAASGNDSEILNTTYSAST